MSDYKLELGNCLEYMATMPDKSVDVILTDPPYSLHVHSKSRRGSSLPDQISRARELGFDAITGGQIDEASRQFSRLAKRWVLVYSNLELCHEWRQALERHGLEYIRTGAWVKLNCTPQFTGDRPGAGFETVTIAHPKGRKRWNGGGKAAVWKHPIVINRDHQTPRLHTTQKPLELITEQVKQFSDEDETVFDPYMGSGTTGHACLLTGRRFIGCEISPEYHAVASKRLAAVEAQQSLFSLT